MLWLWFLTKCIQGFVISFTTGIWYYQSGLAQQDQATLATTTSPVTAGMKLAFTKSFGSLCFGSLVITVCEYLRRVARSQARDGGLLGLLIYW